MKTVDITEITKELDSIHSVEMRKKTIDERVSDHWLWPVHDAGAWDGPIEDWKSHKEKYFTHVKKFDTVVTAGANCGLYARVYSKLFGTVFAFEPSWLSFYCLSVNCPYANVKKFNAALGDTCNQDNKLIINHLSNIGTHKIGPTGELMISTMTIDSMNLKSLDFLQLDAEGYESYIIEGARRTIAKFSPVIVLEAPNGEAREKLNGLEYKEVDVSKADVIFVKG